MGGGSLTCRYSLIKVPLASKVALSAATSLLSLFNPVFLKTSGKHFKKSISLVVCIVNHQIHDQSSQWAGSPVRCALC